MITLKPKIKKITPFLRFFLFNNVSGICLAPFGIFIDEKYITNERIINHEKIHWKQQIEMFILFFYLFYLIEWLIKLIFKPNAYYSLSFEREAYENDGNKNYLNTRKNYNWIKYI